MLVCLRFPRSFLKLAYRNGNSVFDGFSRTVDTQDYSSASTPSRMAYNNYGGGTNRNLDLSKTEADLSINIRKATSIGEPDTIREPEFYQLLQKS